VKSIAFSPDGKRLASGHTGGIIQLWDTATGKELLTLKGHLGDVASVTFSPDGKRLVSGSEGYSGRSDNTIKLWGTVTGKELLTLRGHSQGVCSVAFSPDGKRLASGSQDLTIKLWDTVTGKELLTLKEHSQAVLSVAFSPDGKRLASGSLDQSIKLWNTLDWTKSAEQLKLEKIEQHPVSPAPKTRPSIVYHGVGNTEQITITPSTPETTPLASQPADGEAIPPPRTLAKPATRPAGLPVSDRVISQ